MSTLDMNRAASFTYGYQNTNVSTGYGESVSNEIWELVIDAVLLKYTEHSVLALTKTIFLIEHVLLNGADAVCSDGQLLYRIEMAVQPLRELNTALVEQQILDKILNHDSSIDNNNYNGRRANNDVVLTASAISEQLSNFSTRAAATMLKLKGGSIDQGYPVRMAANKLYGIVANPNNLRQLRLQTANNNNQQSNTSLVPIGSAKKVGFITDDGRYRLLQQKMEREERELQAKKWKEEQQMKATRSNLVGSSAVDSFGGGYNATNGKSQVVGAAHSLEDMIKSARYELEQHKKKRKEQISTMKKGYSDNPMEMARKVRELEKQSDVTKDPKFIEKERALQEALEYLEELQREQQQQDLLGGGDLLAGNNINATAPTSASNEAYYNSGSEDLLGFQNNVVFQQPVDAFGGSSSSVGGTADLLGYDGFSGTSSHQQHQQEPRQQKQQPQQQYRQEQQQQVHSHFRPHQNTFKPSNLSFGSGNFLPSPVEKIEMRPSLVTGTMPMTGKSTTDDNLWKGWHATSTDNIAPVRTSTEDMASLGAMGGIPGSSFQTEEDEDVQLERERKMNMAAGLFAGIFPVDSRLTADSGNQMSSFSAPAIDPFDSMPSPPMDAPPPPPPGGMPPPPPPTEAPPPPPSNDGDASVEQMQEIIRQQQQQMNEMMQMMQQMQMQNRGMGGWPTS